MSDILIIKMVFGTMLSIFGIVLVILSYKIGYKYLVQQKRCTQCTIGHVYRYTAASRAPGIFYPIVKYEVQGKTYKVVGPEFRKIITVTNSALWNDNSVSYEIDDEKQILKLNRTENSLISIRKNPLTEIYPIGVGVNVFYDPNRPKLAFVERYCNRKWLFCVFIVPVIFCFLMMTAILILL